MRPTCQVHWLGVVPYEQAWQLQNQLAAEIGLGERPPTLLLLEHPHTYTFGSRGQPDNLIWDQHELLRRGISVHWVDRGGDVTYHGPGQLVGYPLLPLAAGGLLISPIVEPERLPQVDFVGYLRVLERVLIGALHQLGVTAKQVPGFTGVWVPKQHPLPGLAESANPIHQHAKIASIGVKVDVKGISRHGFALNVNPDMSYWEGIVACGLQGYQQTSLGELLESLPSMDAVISTVLLSFEKEFGYRLEWCDTV